MTVSTKTRTMDGAKFVMLKKQEMKDLLAEIEFKLGSWQDLQADYKRCYGKVLSDRKLPGYLVVWMNYNRKTVYSPICCIYDDNAMQNDLIFRKVLNALTTMATYYDMLELYEFARYGDVLRAHLIEIGMLKKEKEVEHG